MPYTINGIGTRYIGQAFRRSDGSYITTMWFSILGVPLIPFGSYRVQRTGNDSRGLLGRSIGFAVKPVPMCWSQVRSTFFRWWGSIILGFILFVLVMSLLSDYL